MCSKTSDETRRKETSHALICNTSTMRIERNVKTENAQHVKVALKLPKTVYGVLVTVTSVDVGAHSVPSSAYCCA